MELKHPPTLLSSSDGLFAPYTQRAHVLCSRKQHRLLYTSGLPPKAVDVPKLNGFRLSLPCVWKCLEQIFINRHVHSSLLTKQARAGEGPYMSVTLVISNTRSHVSKAGAPGIA